MPAKFIDRNILVYQNHSPSNWRVILVLWYKPRWSLWPCHRRPHSGWSCHRWSHSRRPHYRRPCHWRRWKRRVHHRRPWKSGWRRWWSCDVHNGVGCEPRIHIVIGRAVSVTGGSFEHPGSTIRIDCPFQSHISPAEIGAHIGRCVIAVGIERNVYGG